MSELAYATRQMRNLWGRSHGELRNEVNLVPVENADPPRADLLFERSTRLNQVPPHAEVRIVITHKMRVVNQRLGRLDEYLITDGSTEPHLGIPLGQLGSRWGEAQWAVRITDPEDPGWTWAWSEPKRIVRGEGMIGHDGAEILMIRRDELPDGHGWALDFPSGYVPTVVVNQNNPSLLEELKTPASLSSVLLIPEVVGGVLDRMVSLHFDGELLEAEDSSWQGKWLKWITEKTNAGIPPNPDSDDGPKLCLEWSRSVVEVIKRKISQSQTIHDLLSGGDE